MFPSLDAEAINAKFAKLTPVPPEQAVLVAPFTLNWDEITSKAMMDYSTVAVVQ